MPDVPQIWKERLARFVSNPVAQELKNWGIRVVAPRHRVGVAVVVGDGNGRVLLLRHVFHAEFPWGLPGGWLSANEDPAVGAQRELREETGLAAETMRPVFIWHETKPSHLGIVFQTTLQPRSMTLSGEILEACWFPVDSLPETATPYAQKAVAAAFGLADGPSDRRIKMSYGE